MLFAPGARSSSGSQGFCLERALRGARSLGGVSPLAASRSLSGFSSTAGAGVTTSDARRVRPHPVRLSRRVCGAPSVDARRPGEHGLGARARRFARRHRSRCRGDRRDCSNVMSERHLHATRTESPCREFSSRQNPMKVRCRESARSSFGARGFDAKSPMIRADFVSARLRFLRACLLSNRLPHHGLRRSTARKTKNMKRRSTLSFAFATALCGLVSFSSERAARAEPTAADKAAAETLFVNARKMMADGKYGDACKAFDESQHLDPGVGTLLNLGRCYEKLGRSASAWSTYREAASAARAARQPAREKNARIAAEALEKSLAMVTIQIASDELSPGLEVRRDGSVLPRALWGMAVAIDPGEHIFEALAPNRQSWRSRVTIEPAKALTLKVPSLEVDHAPPSAAAPGVSPTAVVAKKESSPEPVKPSAQGMGAQRVAALLVGAAGLGALGAGGFYTYRANSLYDSVSCDGKFCDAQAVVVREDAFGKASMATAFTVGGLAAVAGGIVLWLTAPSTPDDDTAKTGSSKARVWVSADPFGSAGTRTVALSGVF